MKLLNLNKKFFSSLILFIFFTPLLSEDSVDIWKKDNLNKPKQKKETFQHQESSSAFDAPNQNTPKEQQESNQGSGNRRLRRAEAKIARKKGKKN